MRLAQELLTHRINKAVRLALAMGEVVQRAGLAFFLVTRPRYVSRPAAQFQASFEILPQLLQKKALRSNHFFW
jgi:hypothetical protein